MPRAAVIAADPDHSDPVPVELTQHMVNALGALGFEVDGVLASFETRRGLHDRPTPRPSWLSRAVCVNDVPEEEWPQINDWPLHRVSEPRQWLSRHRSRRLEIFPEIGTAGWIPLGRAGLEALHASDALEAVVAVGPPYVTYEVASQFNEVSEIPFALLDLESFLYSPRSNARRPLFNRRIARLEEYLRTCRAYWVRDALDAERLETLLVGNDDKVRSLTAQRADHASFDTSDLIPLVRGAFVEAER